MSSHLLTLLNAVVAQLVERVPEEHEVEGAIPSGGIHTRVS